MSEYEKFAWEWQNRRNLETVLSRRAEMRFPWPERRFGKYALRKSYEIRDGIPLESGARAMERAVEDGHVFEPIEQPDSWMTVEELAEEFALSVNTMKRHASKVSDDDKRMRQTGADRQYTWKWDRDGKFDESKYDPPGWRAYRKFSQSKNRDGDKRMPEASRGHGQVLDSRRYVKMIGPSDRRSSTHGGVIGEQVEMMEADESLYSVDPGLAPRQDKGQQVKEYRLSAVREVIEARQPTAGRFTKRAGHAE